MSKNSLKQFLRNQNHSSKATKVSLEGLNPAEYFIVDVRDSKIFSSTPHIANALNFQTFEELKTFCLNHPEQKILLVCNGGLEASKIGTQLVELGLKNIFFLDEYLQIIQDYLPIKNI